jgi:hypothetical protein
MDREKLREQLDAEPRVYRSSFSIWDVLLLAIAVNPTFIRWMLGYDDPVSYRDYIPFLMFVVPLLFMLREYRIDGNGVRRRQLCFWDRWPWEDFESGKLFKGMGRFYFERLSGTFGDRALSFSGLRDEDVAEILEVCSRFWEPPDIPLPEKIEARRGLRHVRLDPEGVTLREGRWVRRFAWNEVHRVFVKKVHPDDQDFRRLWIEVEGPGFTFSATRQGGSRGKRWTGPPAEEILRFIEEYATDVNIVYASDHTFVDSPGEKVERLRMGVRRNRIGAVVCFLALPIVSLLITRISTAPFFPNRLAGILVYSGFLLVYMVFLLARAARAQREVERVRMAGDEEPVETVSGD